MDVNVLTTLISDVGFPIVCVVALAWFAYYMVKKTGEQNATNMEKLQNRCIEREKILYAEIKENREINAKAIQTIAHYAEKLDVIQKDINEIKTDITVIMTTKES